MTGTYCAKTARHQMEIVYNAIKNRYLRISIRAKGMEEFKSYIQNHYKRDRRLLVNLVDKSSEFANFSKFN